MNPAGGSSPASALARWCVEHNGLPPDHELTSASARELAWALKELCYASWSSDPPLATKAAAALRALCASAQAVVPLADERAEMEALAQWTGGIAHLIRGEMSAATRAFDAASRAFEALGRPRDAAQTQVPKIMALAMLGLEDEAAACGEAAQQAFVALGDIGASGRISLNLGSLRLRGDRHAEAARHYRQAAESFDRIGDLEHSAMALIGQADALAALGDCEASAQLYAAAGQLAGTQGLPVLQALVEESKALLDLARGRYGDALAGLESARRRYEGLAMPQHLAIAEKQLADVYLELRLLPEALAGFDAALARFRALEMPVDQAWTLVQRGRALASMGQAPGADAALVAASELFARARNPIGEGAVALARAELALAGDAAAAAAALARAAGRAFETAGLAERRLRSDTVLAQALLQAGDVAASGALFAATLEAARELQLLPVQLRCSNGRGLAARAAGDRRAARAAFEAAIELLEDQVRALPGDEIRSAFLGDHLQPALEMLRLAAEAHEAGPSVASAAAVLEHLDRFRARTLSDRLVRGRRDDDGACANDDDAATRGLRTRLDLLYRRVRRAQEQEEGVTPALISDLRAAECELLERVRRRRLTSAPAMPDASEFSAAALQAALGPRDAIVEYGVLDDELFACVATASAIVVQRRLAAWPQAQDALRALRFQIETLRHGTTPVARHLDTLRLRAHGHLGRLHELLWAPLAPLLAGLERVLIVPHAQLGRVPYAALHDAAGSVADRHQLAVAPSARAALYGLVRRPLPGRRIVALGESSNLPHAGREARLVAGLYARGLALCDRQASIASLREHAPQADVLHLACHAQFRSDNPLFSALHLHDGALTAESVEALRLKPGIVVLSACETALHESGDGNDLWGLPRAFLLAGAARVVASLWPVDDASTADFMESFHAGLSRGQPAALALRTAQQFIRQRHGHPFYWASFVLVGGW